MTDFVFEPLKREQIPLLLGVAGGTGSGKTKSALRVARGIANGHPFAAIDTENGRMGDYAEEFPEAHAVKIAAPYRPSKYSDAIEAAEKHLTALGIPVANQVIVIDSASHEWAGVGGCLDWHDEIEDGKASRKLMAWIEPKREHKRYMELLTHRRAHVILCFRAEPKVEAADGGSKVRPKQSLVGLDGWIPIAQPQMPFELTASFLLMPDRPGVPRPIKLNGQHRPLVPLDEPLSEPVGAAFAQWAAGDLDTTDAIREANEAQVIDLLILADALGKKAQVEAKVDEHRASDSPAVFANWLRVQIANATRAVEAKENPPEESS
jgi:hypothetical protein